MRCDEADEMLDAFAENALEASSSAALARHLDDCARCRRALDASTRLSASLAALPEASPSAAADARVLAAVQEEIAWSRWLARTRRAAVAGAAAVLAAACLVLAFLATPAAAWLSAHGPTLARIVDSWVHLRAAPALFEARGVLAATLVVLVAVAAVERLSVRRGGTAPSTAR